MQEPNACPLRKKCGGCQLQHLSYAEQLQYKQSREEYLLGRFCKPEPILGMKNPTHYRNKVQARLRMMQGTGRLFPACTSPGPTALCR